MCSQCFKSGIMFPFDSPELQSVFHVLILMHDALFLLLKMMTWSFYFWVLVFWFNSYSFAARRGKSKRKKTKHDVHVTWETELCNFHICFKKRFGIVFFIIIIIIIVIIILYLVKIPPCVKTLGHQQVTLFPLFTVGHLSVTRCSYR